ncbi:MAG: hypothetical protein KY476_11585, partial [Planctomycetes bacterium]|nr:hypothetical protein [Planctomycetota bacterium]
MIAPVDGSAGPRDRLSSSDEDLLGRFAGARGRLFGRAAPRAGDPPSPPNKGGEPAPESPADSEAPTGEPARPADDTGREFEESDLPEEIPLTPELVEEDAQRNDFVLRLAVVLLAVLVACTEIGETRTLVHVRSGQYLAEHGLLPPRTDVFSYTAADRPWVNLSWLFDLLLAGVYGAFDALPWVTGAVGLSLLKGVLAGAVFWFVVQASLRGVSTWWGSICATLALLVCFPQLTALPEIVTLLGLSATLWLLARYRHGGGRGNLYALAVVFLLWANLDSRVFLGLSLLVLYALGDLLGTLVNRPEVDEAARRRPLWLAVGGCFAAVLVNPFGWHALLAPFRLYGTEYPWLRVYHRIIETAKDAEALSLLDRGWWYAFEANSVLRLVSLAGIILAGVTLVSFVLNRRRVRPAHLVVYLGFVGFALVAGHELAPAAVVFAVLANQNAQEWYRENFRQTYSIDWSERLFSVGGRAVTVAGLLFVAWLAISGRLMGLTGNRVGFGFRQPLVAEIEGLRNDLEAIPAEQRGFNFLLEQGDVLIWTGRQPYIDSRVSIYTGGGESLIDGHNKARHALRRRHPAREYSGQDELWRKPFEKHGVDYVMPYLGGASPHYATFWDLLASPSWRLTELGSMTAVFHWEGSSEPETQRFAEEERFDPTELAFQTAAKEPLKDRLDWARPRSWYDRTVYLPKVKLPPEIQRSRHYLEQVREASSGNYQPPLAESIAAANLAVRYANRGLADDPDNPVGYRILGHAFEFLEEAENAVNYRLSGNSWYRRRYLQAINAYSQALEIHPGDALTWQRLRNLFFNHQRYDLAVRAIDEVERHLPSASELDAAGQRSLAEERRINKQMREELRKV